MDITFDCPLEVLELAKSVDAGDKIIGCLAQRAHCI